MSDHRACVRALLSQARVTPAEGSKLSPDLDRAVLLGGSVAAVSYTVASDCVQFRPAP
jgi:hypothetical protein